MNITKQAVKRFLFINFGILTLSLGFHIFIVPAKLATGGVTGLGLVVKAYFPQINLGVLMLLFNIILFALAFIFIGKDFGGYTIYASLGTSTMMGVLERFAPIHEPVTDEMLLNLMFGTFIAAAGIAIVFYQNASTGGTDILAKIINKFTGIEIGKALFLADSLITIAAGYTFGLTTGMYAFMGIILNSTVIDKVIAGFETKVYVQIISEEVEEITSYIHHKLVRGMTLLTATGGYSKEEKKVIAVVLTPRQYLNLKAYVKSIDPEAFLIMSYVHEVLGKGFKIVQ